jgi:DNA (cytosine-5)-methyltransferase 1
MPYRLIDLFSGAGGMTLGFAKGESARSFSSVLALDNDAAAAATYAANFGDHAITGDIEAWVEAGDIPAADIIIGGPPCQGFSLLNKKRSGDERRALWEPYLEVASRSGARVFVMENVAELFRSPELQNIKQRADEHGFSTIEAILNAADFGAPQTRKRTVVIGWRRDLLPDGIAMPEQTHFVNAEPGANNRWVTVRDVISDLPKMPKGTEIGKIAPLDLHFGRNPTELSRKRYRKVPEGGNRFDLQRNAPELTPGCWIRKTSGGTDLFGRLWWDRPSVTIRTEFFKPEKGRYLHPIEHRPITHREAARLMGFPDDFKFTGTKTEIARQIGNAVPPALARAIAKAVLKGLHAAEREQAANHGKKIAAE